jgi:hypothetical protein
VRLVDDRLLLDLLSDTADAELSAAFADGEVFTTGSWYYRLARAVSAGSGAGSLSGAFQALNESERQRVLVSMDELPEEIGLLSLRVVVPVIQALPVSGRLNFLSAEAIGAAILLGAVITVTVETPLLREAAVEVAVPFEVRT